MIDYLDVQRRLHALGFDPGPLDGIRGPRTDAAVVAFKRSIGLRARPYIGPLTRDALFGGRQLHHASAQSPVPWMVHARAMEGLHERRDYAALRGWLGAMNWRDVPWCGAFVQTVFRTWKPDLAMPPRPLMARDWLKFGEPCAPTLGAVVVFWRGSPGGWQGHVGFVVGISQDGRRIRCLGGNQSNQVNERWFDVKRVLGYRWPANQPFQTNLPVIAWDGAPVSINEA